jgi:hypothetical protein
LAIFFVDYEEKKVFPDVKAVRVKALVTFHTVAFEKNSIGLVNFITSYSSTS